MRLALVGLLVALCAPPVAAQTSFRLNGQFFADYAYVLDSPDPDRVDYNTFNLRRLFLTANMTFSDDFTGRFRLEMRDRTRGADGNRIVPFVKDAYVTWNGALGEGHDLTLGILQPPSYNVSENMWGYRDLVQAAYDRVQITDSREFGLRASGPVPGAPIVTYTAMVGNGQDALSEALDQTGKQVYGTLEVRPAEGVLLMGGATHEWLDAPADAREGRLALPFLFAYVTDRVRLGTDIIYVRTRFNDGRNATDGFVLSGYAGYDFSEQWGVIGRYDFVEADAGRAGADEHFGVAAVVFRPSAPLRLRLMPNLVVQDFEGQDPEVQARFTLGLFF